MSDLANPRRVLTVSALAGAARFLLEERFALVWVAGEISNLRVPSSGHWYFTLKDDRAQIRCAMFASRNRRVRFAPKDGDQVLLRGRVSLYEPRGDFQLIGEHLEAAGAGALQAAFEALKEKLAGEGLFAADAKRPLPEYPRHIAIVSSRTGAAVRDILAVFRRRCPTLRVTLVPVAVQGGGASAEISRALDLFTDWPVALGERPQTVLLARGGGSLEDLAAFNSEPVARAIRRCPVPVVAAVGHETDVTIADFAADLRAPTPSAGAEVLAPDLDAWWQHMLRLNRTLGTQMRSVLLRHGSQVAHLRRRLVHPGRALQQRMQRLDDLDRRLAQIWRALHNQGVTRLAVLSARLRRFEPKREIAVANKTVAGLAGRLDRAVHLALQRSTQGLTLQMRALNAVSPLNTLGRGYAILTEPAPAGARWGPAVTRVGDTAVGRDIVAQLVDGRLRCSITEVISDDA